MSPPPPSSAKILEPVTDDRRAPDGISGLLFNLPTASLVPLSPPEHHLPFTGDLNSSYRPDTLNPPLGGTVRKDRIATIEVHMRSASGLYSYLIQPQRETLRLAQPRSSAGRSDPMFRMSAVFNTVSDCFDFNIPTQCFKERLRLLPWPQ